METKLTYLNMTALHKKLEELSASSWFAVIDEKVKSHLPEWLQQDQNVFWIQAPEEQKEFSTYQKLCSFLLQKGAERSSLVIAIGGGATTDLAGFAASSVLRGISWISIPTTLLGMVDGSIGGKVAINTPEGKNLVGAFHQPKEVLICGDFLSTLAPSELLSGKGEVYKSALLDKRIFDLIEQQAPLDKIAHACARFKQEIVQRDFKEEGERIFLNLGHTLGHAFEPTYRIAHGQAVVLGISMLFKKFEPFKRSVLEDLAVSLGLPRNWLELPGPLDAEKIISYLKRDKKRSHGLVRLVLLKDIGSPYVKEYPLDELAQWLRDYNDTNS